MEKDKKRYNRSKLPTPLSRSEVQSALSGIRMGEVESVQHLEGGFSNTNYLVRFKSEEKPVVIRIGDLTSRQFEIETSVSSTFTNIKAPVILKKMTSDGMNLAVYKYYDGLLLSTVLDEKIYSAELAFNIGIGLANIHNIKFNNSGFFGDVLEIETVTANFGQELFDYTLDNLNNPRAIKKMGDSLNKAVISIVNAYINRLSQLKNTCSLVHFDFNPKNIIVRNNEVDVILDWEYAASGCPLVDIANFFRFEEDYTPDFLNSFISGYKAGGGELPDDWRELIKLIDLASMSNFITRSDELDTSSKTAVKVFEQTVEIFK